MSAISLDRRLVLEAPTRVADGAGGFTIEWVALGVVWGEVVPGSGREAAGVEVTTAQVPYRITVRAALPGSTARPKAEQRLRDEDRIFTILAVSERDARGQYLTCFAREEVSA